MDKKLARDRLIDATVESVYQHGYNDTTIAKISELADVSLGLVNHYFSGKSELLEQAMLYLLKGMHESMIKSCNDTNSPRGKLWAVVQSILGDDQSNEKATIVWLSFWVQANYDERLKRICHIYNRRLVSNVRSYVRQILQEIGASNIDERTHSIAEMLIGLMHGTWISFATNENVLQDSLATGRLLVWECLEMLLSRAREPLMPDTSTVPTSGQLLTNISLEVTDKDIKNMSQWANRAEVGMPLYIPHFRNAIDLKEKVKMVGQLLTEGFNPVVHIAARNVRHVPELERMVASLSGIGVCNFLLLGGGENPPIGEFNSASQLLQTGIFQKYEVAQVSFAGHPETHPDQSDATMRQALIDKIAMAKAMGIECQIITQFCFATEPFFNFLDWVEEEQFKVPVRLGIAGRVNTAKLMKFSIACGVGRSLSFLKRHFGKSMYLINYSPEGLLAELTARLSVRKYQFPISVHFYPFGSMAETLALVQATSST